MKTTITVRYGLAPINHRLLIKKVEFVPLKWYQLSGDTRYMLKQTFNLFMFFLSMAVMAIGIMGLTK